MVTLVEQDPPRRVLARPRGVDHHQCVVGDDNVGFTACPLRTFDEAATVVRTAGVNAFPATVRQSGRTRTTEKAWKPTREVAADHVAVLGVSRPPTDQLGKHRRTTGECA